MIKILKIMILGLVVLFTTGCVSTSLEVKKPQSEIVKDTTKSYIMFSRSSMFIGGGVPNNIVEFNYDTKELNFVGILMPGERLIYKVEPGEHYFYLSGGENDDYLKVSAKARHMYYVNTYVSMGILMGRTYFDTYDPLSREDIESLEGSTLIEPTDGARDIYNNNLESYISEINEDYPEWSNDNDKKHIKQTNGVPLFH
ncbi:MAG: hypothetical protein U9N59_09885 [Campylobacterota bacterium]|nr:hypothetical protein [Campylobacterota bacterium]